MNAVVKPADAFRQGFAKLASNIRASLPSHISFERFERVAMMAVQRDPKLLADKTDRRSLFMACQRAAGDGLLPDGREGALVRFYDNKSGKEMVQWMPMVAGLMKLARNSGEIASINAHVAYKGETFRVTLGDDERIEHERNLDLADGAEPIAVYAVATLKSGEKVREVMTWAQVMKVRAVSRSKGGPWETWTDEMARKSCIRRLSKRLPLSTDRDGDERLQKAIERTDDDTTIEGAAVGIDDIAPEQGTITDQSSKLDALEGEVVTDDPDADTAAGYVAEVAALDGPLDVRAWAQNNDVKSEMGRWQKERPELFKMVSDAVAGRTQVAK